MFTTVSHNISFELHFLIFWELREPMCFAVLNVDFLPNLTHSTVHGHCCLILLFMMGHTFDRSGLQTGQSSTSTLWCRVSTKPLCCSTYRMKPGIVLLPRKVILMPLMSQLNVHSQYTPPRHWFLHTNASHSCYAHWCTPIPWHVCFCTCRWWKSGWSLSSLDLGLRTQCPSFPKNKLKVDSDMSLGQKKLVASLHRTDV